MLLFRLIRTEINPMETYKNTRKNKNSEKNQQYRELRKKFEEQLCNNLTTKDKDGSPGKSITP
jgi:hypothetical protein